MGGVATTGTPARATIGNMRSAPILHEPFGEEIYVADCANIISVYRKVARERPWSFSALTATEPISRVQRFAYDVATRTASYPL